MAVESRRKAGVGGGGGGGRRWFVVALAVGVLITLYFLMTREPVDDVKIVYVELPCSPPAPSKAAEVQQSIDQKRPYVPPKEGPYNFTGFNNETGIEDMLVPNFVHFLRFDSPEFEFLDFVTVLSALKHQKPERLFFHTNTRFKGELWEKLLLTPGFGDIVEIVHVDLPSEIFGQPMDNGYRVWHAGDITRIRILMKYGGIFLDNDSYLVKSLDKFRHFEMAIGWDQDQFLGTQVLVANKNARFLNEWLETYRGHYNKSLWYYNAGERPTVEVLYKRPELIHRVKLQFGVHYLIHKVYKAGEVWAEWRDQYAIHLLKRHQEKRFDKNNFQSPATTLREMILDLWDPLTETPRIC